MTSDEDNVSEERRWWKKGNETQGERQKETNVYLQLSPYKFLQINLITQDILMKLISFLTLIFFCQHFDIN